MRVMGVMGVITSTTSLRWVGLKSIVLTTLLMVVAGAPGRAEITVRPAAGKVTVEIDGSLFTEYIFADCENPYLYPIIGPHGIRMTRDYPMQVVPGEAHDHPHHRSMWFAHDGLNGVDFWRNADPGHGTVQQERIVGAEDGAQHGVLKTANRWVSPDGVLICRDEREIVFRELPHGRAIDWSVTLIASEGELRIKDSEEGTMAMRTHTNLQLVDRDGTMTANGHALNSEGVRDKAIWGKRAAWIDYWGTIGDHTVGIAMLDHPDNPRHPTWWMARDYGLVAANPFGIHDFEGKPPGTGDMVLKKDERLTLRDRFLFHTGSPETLDLNGEWQRFR